MRTPMGINVAPMNIVYGVSGEGLGHVFEALEIVPLLQADGHAIKVLTYGDRACRFLAGFQPTRIEGLPLHFNHKGLSLWATVGRNLHCIPFYLKNWPRLKRELSAFAPDVFLTAYEPFTTYAAHAFQRPLVSMDNQNELLHLPRSAAPHTFDLKLARLATRICTRGAACYIVKSFRPLGAARRPGSGHRFVAPLVQREIRELQPSDGGHVLVYLTKPNPDLIAILRTIRETFIVYCHGQVGEDGNLCFRAPGPAYLRDLAACKAIIGTTGFSLIADAIYLKKPYFGVPLKKQFEQIHNARFLRESGLGDFSASASRADLERFLAALPGFRAKLAQCDLDPTQQGETLRAVLRELSQGPSDSRPRAALETFARGFTQEGSVNVHRAKEEQKGQGLANGHRHPDPAALLQEAAGNQKDRRVIDR